MVLTNLVPQNIRIVIINANSVETTAMGTCLARTTLAASCSYLAALRLLFPVFSNTFLSVAPPLFSEFGRPLVSCTLVTVYFRVRVVISSCKAPFNVKIVTRSLRPNQYVKDHAVNTLLLVSCLVAS